MLRVVVEFCSVCMRCIFMEMKCKFLVFYADKMSISVDNIFGFDVDYVIIFAAQLTS